MKCIYLFIYSLEVQNKFETSHLYLKKEEKQKKKNETK